MALRIIERLELRATGFADAADGYDRVGRAQDGLADSTREMDAAQAQAAAGFSRTEARLVTLDAALSLVARTAGVAQSAFDALKGPVGLAASFQSELAQVATLGAKFGDDFAAEFDALSRRVEIHGANLGEIAGNLTQSTYDAVSAGVRPAEVIGFLDQVARTGVAGVTDLAKATDALTTGMNAYARQGLTAQQVSDQLFAVVADGVTTFEELASTDLGAQVAQLADLAETGAGISILTKQGRTASVALTQYQAAVNAITTASGEYAKEAKKLGLNLTATEVQARGVSAVLEDIAAATGGDIAVIQKLTGEKEARAGLVALTQDFDAYRETLDRITNSQGATARAAKTMSETTTGALARFNALAEGTLRDIGEVLLPVVNRLLTDISEWMRANGDRMVEVFARAVDKMVEMGEWAVANGPTIIKTLAAIFATKKVTEWVIAAKGAIAAIGGLGAAAGAAGPAIAGGLFSAQGMSVALKAALGSPLVVAAAAGAAVVLGQVIGDKLGASLANSTARQLADRLEREQGEALRASNTAHAGARGFDSMVDLAAASEQVVAGALIPRQGVDILAEGIDVANDLATAAQLVAEQGEAAAATAQSVAASLTEAADSARAQMEAKRLEFEQVSAELAAAEQVSAELARLRSVASPSLAQNRELHRLKRLRAELPTTVQELRAQADALNAAVNGLHDRAQQLEAGASTVVQAVFDELGRVSAEADAEKKRLDAIRDAREKAEREAAAARVAARRARRLEVENAARAALALAEAATDAERRLIQFELTAADTRAAAQKAGADMLLVEASIGAQRKKILDDIAEATAEARRKVAADDEAMFADLSATAQRAGEEAARAQEAYAEALRRAREEAIPTLGGVDTSAAGEALANRAARSRDTQAARQRLAEFDADAVGRPVPDDDRRRRAELAAEEQRAARQQASRAAGVSAALAEGFAAQSQAMGGFLDVERQEAELDRLRKHHEEVLKEQRKHVDDVTALEEQFAAQREQIAQRTQYMLIASYTSAGQAALSTMAAVAKQAGASAKTVGIIEKLALGATAVQEGVFAVRDAALAATHYVPGPLFNPAAAVGYTASSAAHAATAALAGVQAVGLGGGGGASAGLGRSSVPTLPQASVAQPVPPLDRVQQQAVNMTINGVMLTDRRNARAVGREVGSYAVDAIGEQNGSRGQPQIPRRAFGG